ncbi:hypothetical protein BHE74_00001123 [Ensete ventricosum]|nr:hypothetical protein BHE74_00001123 [Ensete ventricosum]
MPELGRAPRRRLFEARYRYMDRSLPGGTAKIGRRRSIEGEIDCRWLIEGEIDCRRLIEGEKGKKTKKRKRRKKEEENKKE